MNRTLIATEFINPTKVAEEFKEVVKPVKLVNKLTGTSKYNSLSDIANEKLVYANIIV